MLGSGNVYGIDHHHDHKAIGVSSHGNEALVHGRRDSEECAEV
jgi:hypothetical protein